MGKRKRSSGARATPRTRDAVATASARPPGRTGTAPPPPKKTKTAGAFTGATTPAATTPAAAAPRRTTFEIKQRTGLPAMTRVKLLPRIVVANGKITSISFGRDRTPSPFGGKMGDHTSAWTSVVDDVHARLYVNVPDAVAELRTMQSHAQAWMSDAASTGMKLWNMLPPADQDRRREPLENYAYTVNDLLTKADALLLASGTSTAARKEADERVPELLAEATAHHLAFLNFLPFATVPAEGASGSKGAAESTARARVMDVEVEVEDTLKQQDYLAKETAEQKKQREDDAAADAKSLLATETPAQTKKREDEAAKAAKAAKAQQLQNASNGLWDLFSMEAAVRAADLDPVVAPTRIAGHVTQLRELLTAAGEVKSTLNGFSLPDAPEGQRRKQQPPNPGPNYGHAAEWKKTAEKLKTATDLPYAEVRLLATEVENAVARMQAIKGVNKVLALDSKATVEQQKRIASFSANLDALVTQLSVDPGTALEQSARLLAYLVHDHQARVARAYPNAVEQTKFLGDNPDETAKEQAAARVLAFIKKPVTGVTGWEPDAADRLNDKIKELYPEMGDTPKPGPNTRWVADSPTASLVAEFKGADVVIQGRPAAPRGVGGMGSHTTAWVAEEDWVKKRLRDVGRDALVKTLQDDAVTELSGPLMAKLAHHLPADQLEAGQLGMIFNAAVTLLAATEPADAITAYLSFRNLLPYATVDAGNRGGHAERSGASRDTLFDKKSLEYAIDQKLDELKPGQWKAAAKTLGPGRLDDTVGTLRAAAAAMQTDYDDTSAPTADNPDPTWKSDPKLMAAITSSIKALQGEAERLGQVKADAIAAAAADATMDVEDTIFDGAKTGVHDTIFDTRETEHDSVWNYAYT